MTFRCFVGILLICAAIRAPWMVRDWLQEDTMEVTREKWTVTVPALPDEKREKRKVIEVKPISQDEVKAKSERSLSEGLATSFKTSARALLRGGWTEQAPASDAAGRISQEMGRLGLSLGGPVFVRIFKEERELELWLQKPGKSEFALFKIYQIQNITSEVGPKMQAGDGKRPEGFYFVSASRMLAGKGFDLGYPNPLDRLQHRTGGPALVHGERVTEGAYSVTVPAIEEISTVATAALEGGQDFFRVHCFPFRMHDKQMDPKIQEHPEYQEFWGNLKEGYDFFEILRFPPDVKTQKNGRYEFLIE